MDAAIAEHHGSPDAGTVEPTTAPEPAAPQTISEIASRAIEVAYDRQAKRDAGETVPDEPLSAALDRARERDGRFTARSTAKAPILKPAPSENAQTPTAAEATPAQAVPAPTALQPNPRWSDADKSLFASVPLDVQQRWLDSEGRREADYTRKTQELSAQVKAAEPFVAAYSQHLEFLDAQSSKIGVPPEQIMGNMVRVLQQGTTGQPHERAQAAAYVLHLFGLDASPLKVANRGPTSQGQAIQGQVSDLVAQEIASLRQQQAEHARFIQQAEQDRQQRDMAAAHQSISALATAKNGSGQAKYPYFDAVREAMAPHVERGASFDEAYNVAAKPIVDAVAAHEARARQVSQTQAGTPAGVADGSRAPTVAHASRAVGSRPSGPKPSAPQFQDISGIAWEAMKKVGLAG